jgi:hypothetical protein
MDWETASLGDKRLRDLIFHLFAFDRRLLDFCFDPDKPRLRKRAGLLKEDAWGFSHGVALELWSGSGHVFLWELIETLDDNNLMRVMHTVVELRGIRPMLKGNDHDTP